MKLWTKIFIGTLVLFTIAFNAGVLYLTNYSYNVNRQRETENSIREQEMVRSLITSRLQYAERFFPDAENNNERISAILFPLADFYEQQGVEISLYSHGYAFTGIQNDISELLVFENIQNKNVKEDTIDGKRYVFVASRLLEYPQFTLIYAKDISHIDDFRVNIGRVFAIINVCVLVFLGLSIYFLLKHITKPISKLTAITTDIADGAYDKRVDVKSSDEVGMLAGSFNRMADSIEENVAKLRKSVEDKQQFIDDLTHEIKTPMTTILGYSEYLHNAKINEEERMIASAHLHEMALRLENLSEKLMDLAYSRDENIERENVDLPDLFNELEMMMRPKLNPRSMELLAFSEMMHITGDKMLLLMMLQNLVDNAINASTDRAVITVRSYFEDHPIIEVKDAGCGIDRKDLERITAPFYRVDKSRSRQHGGVGLGLSIVSQIASLHGAKVEIESEPGAGTAVKIKFESVMEGNNFEK